MFLQFSNIWISVLADFGQKGPMFLQFSNMGDQCSCSFRTKTPQCSCSFRTFENCNNIGGTNVLAVFEHPGAVGTSVLAVFEDPGARALGFRVWGSSVWGSRV